eukprot:CAMPEP_0197829184 /NCGR_PEP_ID=MMETSP1437-20131217/5634_1 /TAXON_ID=49252 ORGANISM="Eucampia antarctica, Strain CCMP1452" /NCGR_SAMPLE_ID=MMETSP1437 /ASSEMBLY_ACC=CAM_ASM_001096 /LENGTH=600 /DNA_ID=CAMNT_0043430717 /DNA_START=48 /DNA_END=1850 /DNA_ORIENTATION=-
MSNEPPVEEVSIEPGNLKDDYASDPFQLIERGNAYESSGNHWGAAGCFGRASLVLKCEGDKVFSSIENSSSKPKRELGIQSSMKQILAEGRRLSEQEKIGNLYHTQSLDYLYKARDCLIQALRFENEDDQNRQKQTKDLQSIENRRCTELEGSLKMQLPHEIFQPLLRLISPVEAVRRTRIFQQIYSDIEQQEQSVLPNPPAVVALKEMEEVNSNQLKTIPPNIDTNIEQINNEEEHPSLENQETDPSQLSLEERLARLESTLPPRAKTDEQRVLDIRQGLDQLGVHILESTPIQQAIPISEDEEVENIIAQVTDEALYYNSTDGTDEDNQNKKGSIESILRKSGIRIDVDQFNALDDQNEQENVQDLLNRAGKLQDEAKSYIQDETNIDILKDSIENDDATTGKNLKEIDTHENEKGSVQELLNSTKILSNEDKSSNIEATKEDISNKSLKNSVQTSEENIQESTKDNDEHQHESVQQLLNNAEKLQVEAKSSIEADKKGNSTENSIKKAYNDTKAKPQNSFKVMEENLELLTATHTLIDKASHYLEEDILENDLDEESDSGEESDQKMAKNSKEIRDKGKASITAAMECLQKILDTWP